MARSKTNSRVNSTHGSSEDLTSLDSSDKLETTFNSDVLEDAVVSAFVETPATKVSAISLR